VDPAQDAFYHELKSKLWKLAQELELRQPQRVIIPEGVERPSPEIPTPENDYDDYYEYDDDSEDDEEDIEVFENGMPGSRLQFSCVRRPSEGRGRTAARNRAEKARLKWLRGPD